MARKGWSAASRSSVLATKNIGFCTFRSPRIVVPSSELRRRIINEALYLASIKAGVFQQPAKRRGMKRRELLRHLTEHGCHLIREGSRHSVFSNPRNN